MAQRLFDIQARRQKTLDRDGSPNFRHTFGAIADGGNEPISMQTRFPASRKYEPLKILVITNNSAADLDLEINGVDFALVPAGVIFSASDEAIWSFRLSNSSGTAAAAGAVRANISKKPVDADEAARRAV